QPSQSRGLFRRSHLQYVLLAELGGGINYTTNKPPNSLKINLKNSLFVTTYSENNTFINV
ncbi:MAG: hypothetical protein RLZZ292_1340, partial [Bacteroidota bacterium]